MSSRRPPNPRPTLPPSRPPTPNPASPDAGTRPTTHWLHVAGLAAVSALFRQSPERVVRLFYEDRRVPDVGGFCAILAGLRRPYRKVESEALVKIAGTVLHGGVVAVVEPQPEHPLTTAAARQLAKARQPLFILDGIGNPHNLGAIARTLAFFGFKHLALSDHPLQAGLSGAAYRIAEGGLDCLTIHRIQALPAWLRQIQPLYLTAGTTLGPRGHPLETLKDDRRPVAIVLGNEETGVPKDTLAACERVVTLSGAGAMQSLNVAATAAILAHALRPKPVKDKSKEDRGQR